LLHTTFFLITALLPSCHKEAFPGLGQINTGFGKEVRCGTIGDWGYPLPFNEFWTAGDAIYETRAVDHSFTGKNSSYLYVTRPSGIGSFLLMVPEDDTGAGFEYQDHWRTAEHSSSSETAWCQDQSGWQNGLNVFYIHSDSIKSTNRGYLPNTSLTLAASASKTYSFKFFKVADEAAMKAKLYSEGLIDVTVVPGMIVSTDMTAKFDLHTSKTINSITAKYPSATTITSLGTVSDNHKLYSIWMSTLGQNDITINYGSGETTTLQFYVIEPLGTALQRHSSFMVNSTQWGATGDIRGIIRYIKSSVAVRNVPDGGTAFPCSNLYSSLRVFSFSHSCSSLSRWGERRAYTFS
jgi:hypothetical protein